VKIGFLAFLPESRSSVQNKLLEVGIACHALAKLATQTAEALAVGMFAQDIAEEDSMDLGVVVPLNSRTSYWDPVTELSILVDLSGMLRRRL